ncbi:Transcription antitermination protein NusB [bioreactor metagenome]|uniref:Transcription antitermination protein NusB n=1 Tax=bioreactor metagenome TaxID=1076179 RepID=A0A645B4L2_9ZZZZ|nr:transcription antitermination factor NusB [Oscillospiraceae bacterium]
MPLNRRKERETVFIMLFQAGFNGGVDAEALYNDILTEAESPELFESRYIKETFLGSLAHADESFALIREHAVGWKAERISRVSIAILKLAIFELLWSPTVGTSIAINEAVELSKTYDDEKVSAFINGVLGNIARAKGI